MSRIFQRIHNLLILKGKFLGLGMLGLDLTFHQEHSDLNMNAFNLTPQQLRQAADIQERIISLQNELGQLLGTGVTNSRLGLAKRGRPRLASIARIRTASKKRRAATGAAKASIARRRRRVSPALKAKLSAIAKARWKKAKEAGKATL